MVPLRLSLRNFLCYRDRVTLDLEGIHIACLCGDNGHGKSALLDAITWALWGRSRARSNDDLIHLGQEEAAQDLESAVIGLLEQGEVLTPDLGGTATTEQVGKAVVRALES